MPNDKILITQKEFDELYAVIEGDTPQPDLDKLKEDKLEEKPEEDFLTKEEEEQDDKLFEGLTMEDIQE